MTISKDMTIGELLRVDENIVPILMRAGMHCICLLYTSMEYVGIAIASSINLLDPDTIILAGGLTKSQDLFFEQMQKTVAKYKMKYTGKNVVIRIGTLGEYATDIGAATMLTSLFIEKRCV